MTSPAAGDFPPIVTFGEEFVQVPQENKPSAPGGIRSTSMRRSGFAESYRSASRWNSSS
jgi:hypothetical protein